MSLAAEVHLFVFVVLPSGRCLLAGRLLSRNLRLPGRYEGFFRYDPAYLDDPEARPLDPLHLPLESRTQAAARPESGLHALFEDSLPDAWGRRILARRAGLSLQSYTPAHLLAALGGGGLGALFYAPEPDFPGIREQAIDFRDIEPALAEAARFEERLDPEELNYLLSCASSAGGARPKLLCRLEGREWIAKFSSIRDPDPGLLVRLEAAGLALARAAGLRVPEFRVEEVRGRPVLLVRRFDLTGAGRNAIISFRTLLGVDDYPDFIRYADLAGVLRRLSVRPGEDVEALYRHMLVNALLFNTDDHLQNFAMLHGQEGLRLSPAYDIVPSPWREPLLLRINGRHTDLEREDLLAEGRAAGLSPARCRDLLDQVLEGLRHWQDYPVLETAPGLGERIRARMERIAGGRRGGAVTG